MGKKFTDFGTLIRKKLHLELPKFLIVSKYHLVLAFILNVVFYFQNLLQYQSSQRLTKLNDKRSESNFLLFPPPRWLPTRSPCSLVLRLANRHSNLTWLHPRPTLPPPKKEANKKNGVHKNVRCTKENFY